VKVHVDGVEHEGDLLQGGLGRGGGDDRVGHDLLLRGDAALLDLDGVELLGRAVAVGFGRKNLNSPSMTWFSTSALAMSGEDLSMRLRMSRGSYWRRPVAMPEPASRAVFTACS
jgi:hypothetical protein